MTDVETTPAAVVIERHFDAPVGLVWAMWTDADHFKSWYGPAGADVTVARMDVRVGGSRLVCMDVHTPGGPRQMCFVGEYLEVVENARLVYTESLADERGEPLAAPGPHHPATTQVRVELTQVGDGTRVLLTHVGIPADSPGAAGWAAALARLAEQLPT